MICSSPLGEEESVVCFSHQVMFDSFGIPWPVARQAPLSMGFPRQEYRSGLPFPSPRDLSEPGMEPGSPALQADSLPLSHQGSPSLSFITFLFQSVNPTATLVKNNF